MNAKPIFGLFVFVCFLACGPESFAGDDAADPAGLAKRARGILKTHCHGCHGKDGAAEGAVNYILDLGKLVERKLVVAGKPAESKLYRRLTSTESPMPPLHDSDGRPLGRRPEAAEIAVLEQWIEAGAPNVASSAGERPFVSPEQVARRISADLAERSELDRRFTRYFTLAHLYNAGLSDDELATYRNSLSKLVNSLSWAKDVTPPQPIEPAGTILRIDLRDYKWSRELWEAIAAVYPYGAISAADAEADFPAAAGTRLPYLRGDWFLATASRPPLYHQILRLPETERALENLLQVNRRENIQGAQTARAGFNGSGVSNNNRLIERHETPFGAYWKSYDFEGASGRQNIFEHPLGPGNGRYDFHPDGGEIIFNLPNGLQAYLLVDRQGNRIDKAPTAIVSDPRRPDRAVENGLSCMSCHARGIINKTDQIRDHVQQNLASFSEDAIDRVLALYPPAEEFQKLQDGDAQRFLKALAAAGAPAGTSEPLPTLVRRYELQLDLTAAAAELGLRPQEFLDRLEETPQLGRTLGALKAAGGTVQRDIFARAFRTLVEQWKLGQYLQPGSGALPATIAGGYGAADDAAVPGIGREVPRPQFPRATVEIKLPETYDEVRTGGAGRYLVFLFKRTKRLALFDVSQLQIVHTFHFQTEDILYACGLDHLLVVLPGQRVIQRWNLHTYEREAVAAYNEDSTILACLMGSASHGPLVLWNGGPVLFWDIERMERFEVEGPVIHGGAQWGMSLRVSADGQTFVGWVPRISSQRYTLMRLDGRQAIELKSPDSASYNEHWAFPNADGSLIFRHGGGVYSRDMRRIETDALNGAVLLPAEDPRFFLAVRAQGKEKSQVTVCTAAELNPIHTIENVEPMNTSSLWTRWGFVIAEPQIRHVPREIRVKQLGLEPQVRYLPSADVLLTLPHGHQRIVVRRFNLMEALAKSERDYLFVASQPPTPAVAGSAFEYSIDVVSKAGGLDFRLESGPEGMTLSDSGRLHWKVPDDIAGEIHHVLVGITNSAGREYFHSFDLPVADSAPKTRLWLASTGRFSDTARFADFPAPAENAPAGDAAPPAGSPQPGEAGRPARPPANARRPNNSGRPANRGAVARNANQPDRLLISNERYHLTPGRNHESLLLLEGNVLTRLGPDGFTPDGKYRLPGVYERIGERGSSYIAVARDPNVLDVIDQQTRKLVRRIPLEVEGVDVLEVSDLAVHPRRPFSFVAVKHSADLPRYRVLVVDEAEGKVSAPDGLIGTWLAVDPFGRRLYAGYADVYTRGSRFHFNPGARELIEIPDFGNIDWLISYDLRGRNPTMRRVLRDAGRNGKGLVLSPDGRRISYLSPAGAPAGSGGVAAYQAADLNADPVVYGASIRGGPPCLAYHPALPWAAVPSGSSAVFFHRETGAKLPNRLLSAPLGSSSNQVEQLMFSPDGQSLLLVYKSAGSSRFLQKRELELNDDQRRRAGQGVPQPPPGTIIESGQNYLTVKLDEFEALAADGKPSEPLTVKQIASRAVPSVVQIETGEGSGTGFVVGRQGYILTAAHTIELDAPTRVSYLIEAEGEQKTVTTPAKIVRVEDEADLALLKIAAEEPLKPVRLGVEAPIELGEPVTVIGHPGLGDQVLSHTLTTGVVSSARRQLEGQQYIQISAAVNPGNSGGPMFDSHGRVIGLVALKGRIEGAGFAIPAARLKEFLQAAAAN